MYKRLKALRKELKLTQEEFAKSLSLGKSSIAMIETGGRTLLDRHIKLICTLWNVNEDWLVNGNGGMFNTSNAPNDIHLLTDKYHLSDKESIILENYLNMDEDRRQVFLDMLFLLTTKNEKVTNTSATNTTPSTSEKPIILGQDTPESKHIAADDGHKF